MDINRKIKETSGNIIEVIYRNGDFSVSNGRERTLNICKDLFWKEAPENWKDFDGEFSVKYKQSIGIHDCAIIEFHSTEWEKIITNALTKNANVYSITVLVPKRKILDYDGCSYSIEEVIE